MVYSASMNDKAKIDDENLKGECEFELMAFGQWGSLLGLLLQNVRAGYGLQLLQRWVFNAFLLIGSNMAGSEVGFKRNKGKEKKPVGSFSPVTFQAACVNMVCTSPCCHIYEVEQKLNVPCVPSPCTLQATAWDDNSGSSSFMPKGRK